MSIDKRVPARSDAEVRRIAERTKAEFGISRRRPVNILRCLESGSVLTLYGRKKLVFIVVDDSELGTADAKTDFSNGVVTITCQRSVRDRAAMGVGRDRMHHPVQDQWRQPRRQVGIEARAHVSGASSKGLCRRIPNPRRRRCRNGERPGNFGAIRN
jgi:hypothetical protein